MTDSNTPLSVRWTETHGELEHRVIQDGDAFLLVTRRFRDGRWPEYVYWHAHTTLDAARNDVPNAENFAS